MGGVPSGTFASQNPQLSRMSAESQRRSFAYIPPEGRSQQPPQARLQDDQRRGGENGGVPRGTQVTEGPKMVGWSKLILTCTYDYTHSSLTHTHTPPSHTPPSLPHTHTPPSLPHMHTPPSLPHTHSSLQRFESTSASSTVRSCVVHCGA